MTGRDATVLRADPAVRVRAMRPHDVSTVVAIEAGWQARPWPAAVFHAELDRTDRVYLVATGPRRGLRRPAVLGYAGALVAAGEAHVMTVAVAPDARRRGVGAGLVRALLDAARERGATTATLEVRESNDAARRLYERLGFVSHGLRPGYYGDNGEAARILWLHDLAAAGRG